VRVFRLRMVAAKNSRNRRAACSPASATTPGTTTAADVVAIDLGSGDGQLTGRFGARLGCHFESYLAGFFERYVAHRRLPPSGPTGRLLSSLCPSNERDMREHVLDYFQGGSKFPKRWRTPDGTADASSLNGTLIRGRLDWAASGEAAKRLLPMLLAEPISFPRQHVPATTL
jgi:hypothetical protein